MILRAHGAFDCYVLVRRLGGGGMGEVYLATTEDGRQVALKLVPIRDDDDSRAIVAAERVGARLQQLFGASDPHVPGVMRIDEADGFFFIEMEFVDGHDLAELIPRGIAPERAAWIAGELCRFLEHAHAFSARVEDREFHALVHADLKPKNIRINSRDELKVLDFGISRGLSMTGRLTTAAFGSRLYMSPEWLDTGRLDRHVDLWAAGVVLYEMLAGHPPYRTQNDRQLELLLRAGTPPLPLPDTCPLPLRSVVAKALAHTQEARYQTAAAFGADIAAWLEARPTAAEAEAAEREADATRRTTSAVRADDEATRRTTAFSDRAGEETTRTARPSETGTAAPSDAPNTSPRSIRTRVTRWWPRAVLASLLLVIANEYTACQSASTLRAELPTREGGDLDAAWDRYHAIDRRSLLGLARLEVRRPMRDALMTNAGRVIGDFRQDRPVVRERQWEQARGWLVNALQVEPGNQVLLSRLRYCEGHLSRIDGEARLANDQRADADRLLHDAVARFEESARLDKSWPDPWLGLLRVHIYGLEDLPRAVDALNEAERRGHRAGRREHLQLGDAHFARAERDRRDCDTLPVNSRCACLARVEAVYRQSDAWFERLDQDADVTRRLTRLKARQQTLDERLSNLDCE
jgi:serine/threonine protein kinase